MLSAGAYQLTAGDELAVGVGERERRRHAADALVAVAAGAVEATLGGGGEQLARRG